MDGSDTAVLVAAARGGSTDDLEALYRRAASKLLPLIRLRMGPRLRSRLESRDILQAALLKSYLHLADHAGQAPGSFMAWLARIAENEIRDQADFHGRERRDAARTLPESAAAEVPSPLRSALSQAIVGQEAERAERALEALPEAYREVIVLRKLEELSFAEIAARMGRSEDACRMLLVRAMTALTLQLEDGP